MAAKTNKTNKTRRAARQEVYERPMFRTGTWIMVVLFLALVGLFYLLKNQKETSAAEATPPSESAFLFDSAGSLPTSIEVKPADGEAVRVARNAENAWEMELPEKAEADQATAEEAASQVTSLKINSEVDGDPGIFGVNDPAYVIVVEFAYGDKHTLKVGDSTPTNSGYYVQLDDGRIVIVSLSGVDALTNLALFPPYLNTATPSPLPLTETPVPAETTVTPTP